MFTAPLSTLLRIGGNWRPKWIDPVHDTVEESADLSHSSSSPITVKDIR
jgi:hypothetical protein